MLNLDFAGFARWLGRFIVLAAIVALTPIDISAIKQTSLGKGSPKGNATAVRPSIRKTFKSQTHNSLSRHPVVPPIDPLGKSEKPSDWVRPGKTLPDVLGRFGVPQAEKRLWVSAMKRNDGTERLPAGKDLYLHFTKPASRSHAQELGHLKTMEVDIDHRYSLALERGVRGIQPQKRQKPFHVEVKSVSGSIATSIVDDGRTAGIHPRLLSQLNKIFTWQIDLAKDIRPGDSYKILYEQRSQKGQEANSSLRILAAELLSRGRKHTAIYFEKKKGHGNYYNEEGHSLARLFLRFPLEFTRITSGLAKSRLHPILRTKRPHTGVDFAAQRGTPVSAVGDGIIAQAGWNGGYGKAIAIKHDDTYLSRYAHLDRFARGIHRGVSVTRGQIIGYVGSSGRTTGPHLHFEFYKDQRYVNPLSVDLPADEQIEPALQRVFDDQKRMLLVELAAAPQS